MGRSISNEALHRTISGKGDKRVIERYIRNQGREKDIPQLRLFTLD